MNNYGYGNNKAAIDKRLKRIEGQVRGLNKMVQDDKYCIDILTQISAVQSALNNVALELLSEHTRHCLAKDSGDKNALDQKTDELVTAIRRML